MNQLTKKDLLLQYLEMAIHNLLCYSRNYLMSEPKEGYEKEWNEAQEEVHLLDEMIEPLKADKKNTTEELQLQQRYDADKSDINYLKQSAEESFSSCFGVVGFKGVDNQEINNF